MAVYEKKYIVSLHLFDRVTDTSFKLNKGVFDRGEYWTQKGKKVDIDGYKKTHQFEKGIAFHKSYVKVSFINGDVIRIYKTTFIEAQEYYKKLLASIENPLFL